MSKAKVNVLSATAVDLLPMQQIPLKSIAWTYPTYNKDTETWNPYGGFIIPNKGRGKGDYGGIDKRLAESLAKGYDSSYPVDVIPATKEEISTVKEAREAYLADKRVTDTDKEIFKQIWGDVEYIGVTGYRRHIHFYHSVLWIQSDENKAEKGVAEKATLDNYQVWCKPHKRTILNDELSLLLVQAKENKDDTLKRKPSDASSLVTAKIFYKHNLTQSEFRQIYGSAGQKLWLALWLDSKTRKLKLFERWTKDAPVDDKEKETSDWLKFSAVRHHELSKIRQRIEQVFPKGETPSPYPTDEEILKVAGKPEKEGDFLSSQKKLQQITESPNLPEKVKKIAAVLNDTKLASTEEIRKELGTIATHETLIKEGIEKGTLPKIVVDTFRFLQGEGTEDMVGRFSEARVKLDKVWS